MPFPPSDDRGRLCGDRDLGVSGLGGRPRLFGSGKLNRFFTDDEEVLGVVVGNVPAEILDIKVDGVLIGIGAGLVGPKGVDNGTGLTFGVIVELTGVAGLGVFWRCVWRTR